VDSGRVDGGCETTAAVVAAATAHSNCGRWQWTAAVEWDARGCTDSERLLLWATAAAVPAKTAHSNCEWWQLKAVVEWDVAGCTNGEWLLLWMTAVAVPAVAVPVVAVPAVAVPAVAVTVAAADSNWGRWLWLGAVHIWQKWQMTVSTEI
jgi:hypothetical protein